MSKIVGALTTALLAFFVDGWLLMLAAGVAHAHWTSQIPTIGYWWACVLAFLIGALFGRSITP